MKFILLLFLVLISGFSLAESRDECSDGSTLEMVNCVKNKQLKINSEIDNIVEYVERRFKYPKPISEILLAQRLWEVYTEAQCRSQVSLRGLSGGMQYQRCLYQKALARKAELVKQTCYEFQQNSCPAIQ
ncbi:lysozyme inhibitor LprI family protein [Endozoicomonas numazuensis]|uniref:Lysozyme inhibitor LprI-like N-terminal domain-containing protein n=1 Tax=Endozoicomonas numazuensis TaxID=1137799 RepID=A0A081NGJ1_9GAMM|nr:lysozyme inhibitor LprI family protein [Endozoicomonas numazuensis]KEQ17564.1 hypothetical protein GZ78_17660 [Endozoicomonas numazuensis]